MEELETPTASLRDMIIKHVCTKVLFCHFSLCKNLILSFFSLQNFNLAIFSLGKNLFLPFFLFGKI